MKYDAQHVLLIVVAILSAIEPHVADLVSPAWQPKVVSLVAGFVAAITAILAIYKTSPADAVVVKAAADAKSLLTLKPNGYAQLQALWEAIAACTVLMVSCAWFQSKGPQVISSIGDIAACVLQHDTETPEQIAVDCGGIAVADVLKVLAAEKAMKARALCPAASAPDAGNPGK